MLVAIPTWMLLIFPFCLRNTVRTMSRGSCWISVIATTGHGQSIIHCRRGLSNQVQGAADTLLNNGRVLTTSEESSLFVYVTHYFLPVLLRSKALTEQHQITRTQNKPINKGLFKAQIKATKKLDYKF